jgi:hypothetical protein
MLAGIADHLWQSFLCCTLCALLALLVRRNAALVRLWLWRICALKFLVPFALPFALGQWLGFPLMHTADPLPPWLVSTAATMTPWLAPARAGALSPAGLVVFLLAGLAGAVACVQFSKRRQLAELGRAWQEAERIESASDDAPPAVGFVKAAVITSCGIWTAGIALLGGAIDDGLWRRELLIENARALRDAPVVMTEAAPGMGTRSRLVARDDGVWIRNINIQHLIAVAYGVSHFSVTSNQFFPEDSAPESNSFLLAPCFDVRIQAQIREPDEFDPYALRQRITRLLVDRFGIEINVNGQCQPPCGRWDKRRDERPL